MGGRWFCGWIDYNVCMSLEENVPVVVCRGGGAGLGFRYCELLKMGMFTHFRTGLCWPRSSECQLSCLDGLDYCLTLATLIHYAFD